jgi:N-acyl homoserine lactone hydrolase
LYDPRTDSADSPYNRLFMGARPNRLLKRGMMSEQKVGHVEDRNTTFRIHPLQTGRVQIKSAQLRRRRGGPARVLLDHAWTGWLPIHAWAIEHPEGVIVVDTGETARTSEPGYFPRWHPFYRTSARIDVAPEQEIGHQLRQIGIEPEQVRTVVLTHLHTDHAGGLHHFPNSEIFVSGKDYRDAQGMLGRLRGYLPHRWPEWFSPMPIPFQTRTFGPFRQSHALTAAGDVTVVPTPGHTAHHVSVIAKADGVSYFLAGDTSYNEALLVERVPDGVSPRAKTTIRTLETILSYTAEEPTVYLPSHDPDATRRLRNRRILSPAS